MKILGFQKTTLLDYPEHVAATVFTGGCNFRCPFCQNADLVYNRLEGYGEEEILSFLQKRKGILDGVCITGGEPTLQPDLETFIRKVRGLGLKVKLDTNGYRPRLLEGWIKEGLLDYVAMDIKASKENYALAAGVSPDCFQLSAIEESVELLKEGQVPYEFRTTVVRGIHRIEEFEQIGRWLQGCTAYFLQSYSDGGRILDGAGLSSFSIEQLRQMAALAGKYIEKVTLRGIEESMS